VSARILITGGAGFIGLHLARALAESSATNELVLVDDFSRGRRDAELQRIGELPNVKLISGDLTDPLTWQRLEGGYDHVYHLAAIVGVKHVRDRPADVLKVNALATMHLLDWFVAGGGGRLLFSSTSEVYAWTQGFFPLPVPTPEDVPLALTDLRNPRSSYAGSKVFGELAVTQICAAHDMPFVIVRYHNVYGPRMGGDHVIPELFERARAGENPLAVYAADHQRAFCYVSDAVQATIAAMGSDRAAGQTINVGNDREEIAIGDLAALILAEAGLTVAVVPTPVDDPIKRRCPDISRARELLDFEPGIELSEGLRLTLDWYAHEHLGSQA